MSIITLLIALFVSSCGVDPLSQKDSSQSQTDDSLITPPADQTAISSSQIQQGEYSTMGYKSSDHNSITSTGEWCAENKKISEFRCGLGNPGTGWVLQPDGCYHRQTSKTCNCSPGGEDWRDYASFTCSGTTMNIVDRCGDKKFVSNHPDCLENNGVIDTQDKDAVTRAYNQIYNKPSPAMDWTGNIDNCQAGTTSLAFQQRVIDQINYYRAMTGLPLAKLVPNMETLQEAALMMESNYRLSHSPDSSWKCYTSLGSSGAGSSNLSLGASGIYAIDLYIVDPGPGNSAAGHRRWILHPNKLNFATGDTPRANALAVFLSGSQSFAGETVAWPNAGYVPYQVLPSRSNRWSFSIKSGSFTNATVEMKNLSTNKDYEVEIEPLDSRYGWNTIVFKPKSFSYSRPSSDTPVEVKIKNVRVGSTYKNYNYTTIIYNP